MYPTGLAGIWWGSKAKGNLVRIAHYKTEASPTRAKLTLGAARLREKIGGVIEPVQALNQPPGLSQ